MYEVDCFQFTGGILKKEFTFNVTWKPFLLQLIHNLPERGIPLKDYLWQKYGKGYAEDIFSANSSVNRNAAEVVSQWRRKEFKSVCVCVGGGGVILMVGAGRGYPSSPATGVWEAPIRVYMCLCPRCQHVSQTMLELKPTLAAVRKSLKLNVRIQHSLTRKLLVYRIDQWWCKKHGNKSDRN